MWRYPTQIIPPEKMATVGLLVKASTLGESWEILRRGASVSPATRHMVVHRAIQEACHLMTVSWLCRVTPSILSKTVQVWGSESCITDLSEVSPSLVTLVISGYPG